MSAMADEVMKEMWKIKDEISNESNKSIRALVERLRKRQRPANQKIINLRRQVANADA